MITPQCGQVKSICVARFALRVTRSSLLEPAIREPKRTAHTAATRNAQRATRNPELYVVEPIQIVALHQTDQLAGVRRVGRVAGAVDFAGELLRVGLDGHRARVARILDKKEPVVDE